MEHPTYDGSPRGGLLVAGMRVAIHETSQRLEARYGGRLMVKEHWWRLEVSLYTWQPRRWGPFQFKRKRLLGWMEAHISPGG